MNDIKNYTNIIFDSIKHIDDYGNEFWFVRELMPVNENSKLVEFSFYL